MSTTEAVSTLQLAKYCSGQIEELMGGKRKQQPVLVGHCGNVRLHNKIRSHMAVIH